jgi:hypothetical protein
MTWARSPAEEELLRRSLTILAATGLPIAVADRGTSVSFLEFLHGLPGIHVTTSEQGLVDQVRASMALASRLNGRRILYTEPDKESFFRDGLAGYLARALRLPDYRLVLAARSNDSFSTYPPMQRYTEGVINHLCGQMLGREGDYSYGPFLIDPAVLPHLADLESTVGWGWRPALFVAAARVGIPVEQVTGDYPCPVGQRIEDASELAHRMRQLAQNISGLLT